jgi:hypothetical protein
VAGRSTESLAFIMPLEDAKVTCDKHGEAYATFVCQHLAKNPAQEWFSRVPTKENPWPDAWCGECDVEFLKFDEWNEQNEACLGPSLLCHNCYEWARSLGTFSDDEG